MLSLLSPVQGLQREALQEDERERATGSQSWGLRGCLPGPALLWAFCELTECMAPVLTTCI